MEKCSQSIRTASAASCSSPTARGLHSSTFSGQRRYFLWGTLGGLSEKMAHVEMYTRGLHWSTFQLNVSNFWGIRWVVSVTKSDSV